MTTMLEFLVGIAFWGGLLVLVLAWMARGGRRGRRTGAAWSHDRPPPTPAPPRPPRTSPTTSPVAERSMPPARPDEQRLRETDALVDGLVIGHFLTRDHYRPRLEALEGELDGLRSDQEPWFDDWSGPGSDDPLDDLDRDLDYAEFDAMAGFGVEPWADELFDAGDEDED